jgi:hypothetical protein
MDDLFSIFTSRLATAGVEYMVTGSVAGMIYGEPRLTHDVDVVVVLAPGEVDRLAAAFPDQEFYFPPREVVFVEVQRGQRGHFNIIHHETGFKADIYVAGDDPLHAWAMQKRRALTVSGQTFWLAPPEYVIVRKLEYYREGGSAKHLEDIRKMLTHSDDAIDRTDLERHIDTLGLRPQWLEAQA